MGSITARWNAQGRTLEEMMAGKRPGLKRNSLIVVLRAS
jgi:hypothetical protein